MGTLQLYSAALSHAGNIRDNNEDSYLIEPGLGLFAVADGMGGVAGGEIASQIAIEGLKKAAANIPDELFLKENSIAGRQQIFDWLSQTIHNLNEEIQDKVKENKRLRGMGCTLDVTLFRGNSVFVAHIGDSRIYLLRQDQLYQLTEDHSLGQMMLSTDTLTAEQAAEHPQRNVLLRALGPFPSAELDMVYYDLAPGDVFLLCTDGVHGEISSELIRKRMGLGAERGTRELIQAALEAGGKDNITAVMTVVEQRADFRPVIVGSERARFAMAQSSLFAAFTLNELVRIQKIAVGRQFNVGEVMIQQGELCDFIMLNIEGKHSIWLDDAKVGSGNIGDPLGELALSPAIAVGTIRAETPVTVLQFPLEPLRALLAADTSIASKLAMAALDRLSIRFRGVVEALAKYRKLFGPLPPE